SVRWLRIVKLSHATAAALGASLAAALGAVTDAAGVAGAAAEGAVVAPPPLHAPSTMAATRGIAATRLPIPLSRSNRTFTTPGVPGCRRTHVGMATPRFARSRSETSSGPARPPPKRRSRYAAVRFGVK